MHGNSGKKLALNGVCVNKHVSVVQLLLTYGADRNVQEKVMPDRYDFIAEKVQRLVSHIIYMHCYVLL